MSVVLTDKEDEFSRPISVTYRAKKLGSRGLNLLPGTVELVGAPISQFKYNNDSLFVINQVTFLLLKFWF